MRFQRARDLVLLVVAAVPAALLVAVAGALVAVMLGRPVLFRQTRSGLGGKPFTIVKLRSMNDAVDGEGRSLPDAERMGRFGRALRATSIDELPALWNILRGEMSFVGPRPLLPEYLPLYSPRQATRLLVLPGLTGWAQVNGRNAVPWDERLEMDAWYVEHRSHLLDLRILVMTVFRVLGGSGVSQQGHATMERFGGTDAA